MAVGLVYDLLPNPNPLCLFAVFRRFKDLTVERESQDTESCVPSPVVFSNICCLGVLRSVGLHDFRWSCASQAQPKLTPLRLFFLSIFFFKQGKERTEFKKRERGEKMSEI